MYVRALCVYDFSTCIHVQVYQTPFSISVDHDRKTVVLAIRGTLSMKVYVTVHELMIKNLCACNTAQYMLVGHHLKTVAQAVLLPHVYMYMYTYLHVAQ